MFCPDLSRASQKLKVDMKSICNQKKQAILQKSQKGMDLSALLLGQIASIFEAFLLLTSLALTSHSPSPQ